MNGSSRNVNTVLITYSYSIPIIAFIRQMDLEKQKGGVPLRDLYLYVSRMKSAQGLKRNEKLGGSILGPSSDTPGWRGSPVLRVSGA